MAADAYLKVAAGQLQQAATAVKQSADQIRAEAATFKQQIEHDINTMQSEMSVRQVELERHKSEPGPAGALTVKVQSLQKQIEMKKQELAQRLSQSEQAARSKEGAVDGLKSQASRLESQAGDPNLR